MAAVSAPSVSLAVRAPWGIGQGSSEDDRDEFARRILGQGVGDVCVTGTEGTYSLILESGPGWSYQLVGDGFFKPVKGLTLAQALDLALQHGHDQVDDELDDDDWVWAHRRYGVPMAGKYQDG